MMFKLYPELDHGLAAKIDFEIERAINLEEYKNIQTTATEEMAKITSSKISNIKIIVYLSGFFVLLDTFSSLIS